jgi:hypothetical protein
MTRAVVVRHETYPDAAEENRRLIEQVLTDLDDRDPGGVAYRAYGDWMVG